MLLLEFLQTLACTVAAYLVGAIPCSLLISKLLYGIDIRDHGDGTATHTNMAAILGWKAGVWAIAINFVKGFLGAGMVFFVHYRFGIFEQDEFPFLEMAFGFATVLGHILPVFSGFRGGNGLYCALGALFSVSPLLTLGFVLIAAVAFLLSRYPIVGYITACLMLPVLVQVHRPALQQSQTFSATLLFCVALALLLGYTHRHDLEGLLRGELQPMKVRFKRKK